jgi:Flp pilus assembly protein TadG
LTGHSERGASAVEFALVLPLLILFLFGIMQFGFILAANQGLEAAAREGGRLAAVGREVTRGEVIQAVRGATVPFVDPASIAVATGNACPPAVDDGAESEITVTASVSGSDYGVELLTFVGVGNPDLVATAVFRCEASHSSY